MTTVPHVSVIIPCRNEVRHIGACLDSLLANDYPKHRLDVLVVDGMSDDGTPAVVERYARAHPSVRLLENPQRVTPAALNLGIGSARGAVIILAGAHAAYCVNYISGLVSWLQRSGADAVGGRCVACPGVDSVMARAIAAAVSHPFGVGNSYFRTGAAAPRWVDTVAFGCYRRDVFDRVGLFDEELVRDQDDEFNQRVLRHGGHLLLVPTIATQYYVRESLGKLWRMFFQYGYFKPLVVRKVKGVMTLRQVIPALFVSTIGLAALLAPWLHIGSLLFGLTLGGYLVADVVAAAGIGQRAGLRVGLAVTAVFPVLHFAYGLGYLLGVLEFLIRGKHPTPAVALSR